VVRARSIQATRAGRPNAHLDHRGVAETCVLDTPQQEFLEEVSLRFNLSPRACQRIIKVARTTADLAGAEAIRMNDLAEAIAYRGIDCGAVQE